VLFRKLPLRIACLLRTDPKLKTEVVFQGSRSAR
jgi:hypothetical protein